MGRPRKHDTHLPKYVYKRGSAYYYEKGASVRLGGDLMSALNAYASMFETPDGGMGALIEQAFPTITAKVKPNTKKQYRIACNHLKRKFAEFAPQEVRQRHVAKMKLQMEDKPNMANRCLSVLRLIFAYAVEMQILDDNPAVGVKPYDEAKRKRLISPAEFAAIYEHAGPRLRIIMDLLYLTGQRVTDVLGIRMSDISPEGIYFQQRKTDARLIVQWNPDLEEVVARAKALQGSVRTLTLLCNKRRKAPDYSTVKIEWNKAVALSGVLDATLRDLRAMSGTAVDAQGKDATALLGHTSKKRTEVYLRAKSVPVVEGPNFVRVLNSVKKAN